MTCRFTHSGGRFHDRREAGQKKDHHGRLMHHGRGRRAADVVL